MRVSVALILILGGCIGVDDLPTQPHSSCSQDYVSVCNAAYANCLRSTACRPPWPFWEMPISCAPTCGHEQRVCYSRCPLD
jgi:hypothetical protein